MDHFKNKKIFYLAKTIFDNSNRKLGISFINDDIYIDRASSYIFNRPDYEVFEGGIIIPDDKYEIIEDCFSQFIESNRIYGQRLNEVRSKCELYEIDVDDILKIFYDEYKDEHNLYLLSKNEIIELNKNYELHLKKHNYETKHFDYEKKEYREEKEAFSLRDYQKETLKKWREGGYKDGILVYHPGLGKTITAMYMLNEYYKYKGKRTLNVIWSTYLLDIIKSQVSDFNLLKDKLNLNILDYTSVKSKTFDKKELKNGKINIILTNNDSLENFYKMLVEEKFKCHVFISDECKRITADNLYNFLLFCKKQNIKIIGLDGTPIKINSSESRIRIIEIFGEKYTIDQITYEEALRKKLCVPLKIIWKYTSENIKKLSKDKYVHILEHEGFYKEIFNGDKTISWADSIEESRHFYRAIEVLNSKYNLKYKNYISNSCDDSNCTELEKYLKKKNNSIINCVNRFKEGTNDKNVSTGIQITPTKNQEIHVFIQKTARLTRLCKNKTEAYYYILIDNQDENEKRSKLIKNMIEYYRDVFGEIMDVKKRKISTEEETKEDKYEVYIENVFSISGLNEIDMEEIFKEIKKINSEKTLSEKKFIKILKDNNITKKTFVEWRMKNHNILNEKYEDYKLLYPNFTWSKVHGGFYNENEIIDIIKKLIDEHELYLKPPTLIMKYLNNLDKKIPQQYDLQYSTFVSKEIEKLLVS